MGEPVIQASEFHIRECAIQKQPLEDRISELPREILVHILSFLTMKEAARTSVLSKHWIGLWMCVGRLDFDASDVSEKLLSMLRNPAVYFSALESERCKYIKWVNEVLRSHSGLALDEFRICFELDQSSQDEIDKWLHHAFSRKVQKLELDLIKEGNPLYLIEEPYAIPHGLFGLSNRRTSDESPSGYCGDGIHTHALNGFQSLRSLRLSGVSVTEDVIKVFLCKFHFLEHLAVNGSYDLMSVEVCGSSLALRHLEICYCYKLKSIIVCDTNLVSLKITKPRNLVVLKNVTTLVDVWIYGFSFRDIVSLFSCCLSKLEVLTLCVKLYDVRRETKEVLELPQMTKLKQLILMTCACEDESLVPYVSSLIRASPNLEKFVLKLQWHYDIARTGRKFEKASSLCLPHLKVLEIYGYYGRTAEDELVKYISENAVALERIIIDAREQLIQYKFELKLPELEKVAKSYAKELFKKLSLLSSPVDLVLL